METANHFDHFNAVRFNVTFFKEQILGIKDYNMSDGTKRPILMVQVPVTTGLWKEVRVWPKAALGEGQVLPKGGVDFLASYGVYVDPKTGATQEGQPKYIGWRDRSTGEVTLLSGEEYTFQE